MRSANPTLSLLRMCGSISGLVDPFIETMASASGTRRERSFDDRRNISALTQLRGETVRALGSTARDRRRPRSRKSISWTSYGLAAS